MSNFPRSAGSTANLPAKVNWLKELKDFNERDYKWLFMLLTGDSPEEKLKDIKDIIFDELNECDGRSFKLLGRNIKIIPDVIRDARSANVISDISWIQKDDHRLLIWLLLEILHDNNLELLVEHPKRFSEISTESRYQTVIDYIDAVLSTSLRSTKEQWLSRLKSRWSHVKSPEKEIRWIDSESPDQLNWAWKYLKGKRQNVRIAEPVTPDECYTAVLASLDCFGKRFGDDLVSDHSAKKSLFLIKFKKAWSQQKFRDSGKAKKPYHLPLTIKAKEALEKLAMIKDRSENEVLEELINREYVQECLDSNGDEKF